VNAVQLSSALMLQLVMEAWELQRAQETAVVVAVFHTDQPQHGVLTSDDFRSMLRSLDASAAKATPAWRSNRMFREAVCQSAVSPQVDAESLAKVRRAHCGLAAQLQSAQRWGLVQRGY
jgi:hypothetical protein